MRLWMVLLVGSLLASPLCAQSGPELDALLEAFFAKDLKTLSQHLPPEAAEIIKQLPEDARQEISERYLLAAQARKQKIRISEPGNGVVLAIDRPVHGDTDAVEHTEIYVEKYLSGGGESMLRFRMRHPEVTGFLGSDWVLTAWLRFTEGDWRVYELDVYGREIRLDDPEYLEFLKRPRPSPNEACAIGALRTINTAAVTYSATFPDIGFPESLEVLGLPQTGEAQAMEDGSFAPSQDHAGLVDGLLSNPPFEKSGYRFKYRKSSASEYSAIARPVRYETDGTVSYFTDESGVIRFTRENREATAEDDPIQ